MSDFKSELAAVRRELHASIRTRLAMMSTSEREQYMCSLNPTQRKLVRAITTGVEPRESACSGATYYSTSAHDMDERMGLHPRRAAVRREGASLIFDALGTTKPHAPKPSASSASRASGALTRSRPTRLSAHADELDRRMGFGSAGPEVQRTKTSLTFDPLARLARAAYAAGGADMMLIDVGVPQRARKRKPQPNEADEQSE